MIANHMWNLLTISLLNSFIDTVCIRFSFWEQKKEIELIKNQLSDLDYKVNDIETKVDELKIQMTGIETRMTGIETKMDLILEALTKPQIAV